MAQPSTGHVFISYSRKDTDVMRRIIGHLRKRGITAWVDNEKLVPGTPIWEREIEKAIRGASAAVVILSPDAKESVWVLNELTLVDEYNKRVFPVLARGDFRDSIPFRLATHQFVDLRDDEATGLEALAAALSHHLEEFRRLEEESRATQQAAYEMEEKTAASQNTKQKPIARNPLAAGDLTGGPPRQARPRKTAANTNLLAIGIMAFAILALCSFGYAITRFAPTIFGTVAGSPTPSQTITSPATSALSFTATQKLSSLTATQKPSTLTPTKAPPTRTEAPPTLTRTREPTNAIINGSVYWVLQPVPGATVQLKEEGGFYTRPALIETTTDANGQFEITDAPVGKYMIYAVAPKGSDYGEWTGRSVTTASNAITKTGTLYLSKKLTLLEPINHGIVSADFPIFKWEAFPNAVNYHIDVFENTSGNAIFRFDTTQTTLVSRVALTANEYQWSVWAYDANGLSLAYYSPFYFTIQP